MDPLSAFLLGLFLGWAITDIIRANGKGKK